MSENIQAGVTITNQSGEKLKAGKYKAIQIGFSEEKPAKANVIFNGNSIFIPKQRIHITFPNQNIMKINGNNFDEQLEPNSPNVITANANTITIKDTSDSNSVKTISVLPKDGTSWDTLTLANISEVVITRSTDAPSPVGWDDLPEGKILWNSEKWKNDKERTLTEHPDRDPYDDKLELRAGDDGKRKFAIDGRGTAKLSGHQSRVYINAHCYNACMQLVYTHKPTQGNDELENLSLRMRSLRNEFESDNVDGRFGGYGFYIYKDKVKADYQPSAGEDKVRLGEKQLEKEIPDDKPVTVKWWVRDVGDKIEVKGWIKYDENSNFEKVYDISSDEYEDYARDKEEFLEHGVAWIRVNAEDQGDEEDQDKHPKDIPIRDVIIIELKDKDDNDDDHGDDDD